MKGRKKSAKKYRKNYICRDSCVFHNSHYFCNSDVNIKRNKICHFYRKPRHWARD